MVASQVSSIYSSNKIFTQFPGGKVKPNMVHIVPVNYAVSFYKVDEMGLQRTENEGTHH